MSDVQPTVVAPIVPPTTARRALVRHSRREDWGKGLILWEREGKRCCQFEDGSVRVFAEEYFELLSPAVKPDLSARRELRVLAIENGHVLPDANGKQDHLPTIEDQVAVFEELYPCGFADDKWVDESRAPDSGRRNKKVRDAAIEDAKKNLGVEALQACVEDGRPGEVVRRVVEVLMRTDLVTKAQVAVLQGLPDDPEVAMAMIAFLHDLRQGEQATMLRLRLALAAHGAKKLSWPLLTGARALLHPTDHICVRASIIRAQAKRQMPRFRLGSEPSGGDYAQVLELGMELRERLTRSGFAPRDLFDVTRFMRVTLSRKQAPRLMATMAARQAELSDG